MMSASTRRVSIRMAVVCGTAVLALSSAAILIRWSNAPALTIAFYRLAGAAVVLLLLAGGDRWRSYRLQNHHRLPAKAGNRRGTAAAAAGVALSGLFLAGHFGLWIASLRVSSVAISVLLVSLHPLLVGLVGGVIGDRLPRRFVPALLLVLPGTALTVFGGVRGTVGATTGGMLLALGGRL